MPIRVHTTNEQFAIVFQEIAQPVMILDLEQRILFANRATVEALNICEEKILGSSCYRLLHKRESPPEECPVLSIINSKLPLTREVFMEVLNKTYLVQCTPLLNENGEIDRIIHIAEDTTERKHKENSLRESEEMFRLLFENAPLANQTLDKDGNIILVNTEWLRLLGYAREEAIGRPFSDFVSHEDRNYFETRCSELKASDMIHDVELTLVRKDGRKTIVSADGFVTKNGNGRIEQMVYILQDITERKRIEVELHKSEERYRQFSQRISEGVVLRNNEGIVTFCNERFCEIFRMEKENILGKHFTTFIHPDDQEKALTSMKAAIESGETTHRELVFQGIRGDGTDFYLRIRDILLVDNSKSQEFQSLVWDITEDKLAYEKLEQQRKELSEFAHEMSHDMTNQFLKLLLYVNLFESGEEPDALDGIRRLVKDMQELLERSITLANVGLAIEKRSDVDLDKILRDIAEFLIPDDIRYDQDLLPQVDGDSTKLRQVFQNLIENAVIHGEPKHIEVRFQENPDCLVIEISNDGIRIPGAIRDKVFTRGFSSKKERKGLGLALVKKIVDAHGWWIDLEISPNTLFRITIPLNAI